MFTSEIGSVYSPPKQGVLQPGDKHVETVIDIGQSGDVSQDHGWNARDYRAKAVLASRAGSCVVRRAASAGY